MRRYWSSRSRCSPVVDRARLMESKGWTQEGRRLIEEARGKGVCVGCGRPSRSKLPLGSARRRIACGPICANRFYETYYQSWTTTKRAVTRRVRERFGEIRCELCGGKPQEISKRVRAEKGTWSYAWTYHHPGYEYDHIVEIAAGGDAQDVNNVQLLCLRCHRRKTRRFVRTHTPAQAKPSQIASLDDFG